MSVSPSPSTPEPSLAQVVDLTAMPNWLPGLIERARTRDGAPPFSDQAILDARRGERHILVIDEEAAAITAPGEAEFVVDPDARGLGLGLAMLDALIARNPGGLLVWAHGDHPAARAIARRRGFTPVRTLLQLRAPIGEPGDVHDDSTSDGTSDDDDGRSSGGAFHPNRPHTVTAFRPGADDSEWLALNARAFAGHPEQGRVSQADLDDLQSEPWFAADDFLVLRDAAGTMVGYAWLKLEVDNEDENDTVHGPAGEFYVVGVDPLRQGEGIGRLLVKSGLERLRDRHARYAHLYVEGDNTAALRLYRSFGFTEHAVDVQYAFNPQHTPAVPTREP